MFVLTTSNHLWQDNFKLHGSRKLAVYDLSQLTKMKRKPYEKIGLKSLKKFCGIIVSYVFIAELLRVDQ